MKRRGLARGCRLLLLLVMLPVVALPAAELSWKRLPDLPDPVGLKGLYAGLSDDRVIFAGGSNFPRPLREGGTKTYHDRIFVRVATAADDAPWIVQPERLPEPAAEGGAVTTPWGVVAVGGLGASGPTARVYLLRWDAGQARVVCRAMPEFPRAAASPAVAFVGTRVFVAGGDDGTGDSALFVSIDMENWIRNTGGASWQNHASWPGPPRQGAVLQVLGDIAAPRLLLAGGKSTRVGYLADAFAYDLAADAWARLPDMPQPALQAASLRLPNGDVAVLGGSDGGHQTHVAAAGEPYRLPARIVVFRAGAGRWEAAGEMPLGVVGAAVVALRRGWIVAGGEHSPGVRTPRTYRVEPAKL